MKLAVPDKISPSYFVAEAAVELGFFKAEGLDVSLELVYPVDKAYEALRDGKIDFVGGAAHAVPAAFPAYKGAKLIAAQAQGMYWFLVMRSDIDAMTPKFGTSPRMPDTGAMVTLSRSRSMPAAANSPRRPVLTHGAAPMVRPLTML